jgi:hypothetical protein
MIGRRKDDQNLKPRKGLRIGNNSEEIGEKKEEVVGGGRRAIIILFLLTIGLSFFFWMQGRLMDWLGSFFGPSTWTFTR